MSYMKHVPVSYKWSDMIHVENVQECASSLQVAIRCAIIYTYTQCKTHKQLKIFHIQLKH